MPLLFLITRGNANMKPNLFDIATKELSQDGFLTWFLQWADTSNAKYDNKLHKSAQAFVKKLLDQDDIEIKTIITERQWEKIDIWVDVNDEWSIIIEDKTNTGEHSNQLETYRKTAQDWCDKNDKKLRCIYLKTGNESLSRIEKVKAKEYAIVTRQDFLNILNLCGSENHIILEFREHLQNIESQTNEFKVFKSMTTKWLAAQGFYCELQKKLSVLTDWDYVPNATGGFIGFWYHFKKKDGIGLIYIQIENKVGSEIRLVVKINEWEKSVNILYAVCNDLCAIGQEYGLDIKKPHRFKTGEYSTVAIVQNAFSCKTDGTFNFEGFLTILKALESTIDSYC